jgi:hypothetical protein
MEEGWGRDRGDRGWGDGGGMGVGGMGEDERSFTRM